MSVLDSFGKCPERERRRDGRGRNKETQGSEAFQRIYQVSVNSWAKEE